ncbi:unnamed protein product [Cyclocybe aegerita]|uniref:Pinin/SDK/MemA protein domain-containing protein n=1 Tax=Cyclocybe aegerita TaxID=1973307 RepID=A0A8S0WEU1_CYCAE|nr:unnamed protein product [Cyclocybe aegerita]
MSSEEAPQNDTRIEEEAAQASPIKPAPTAHEGRKRPRLDVSSLTGGERKRGRSMFGVLVGTLNKAKVEDKERNASEAAKKRQLIEQRLQAKLRKETDSVRRAEEAKKDKTLANRKEEDLQLKDSIYKLRRTRLPILANFLSTSDQIPFDNDSPPPPSKNPLASVPRSHPPPLYYLPVILTPAQEAFIGRRKAEVSEAAEKEWQAFSEERRAGIEEINQLRQRVAEEEARKKAGRSEKKDEMETDAPTREESRSASHPATSIKDKGTDMDVDDGPGTAKGDSKGPTEEKKEEHSGAPADDDDVVEY